MWSLPPVKLPPRQRLKFPHDTHMSITLELPEQITEDLPAHRAETQRLVMTELALTLYAQGKLPPGRAAETAGIFSNWRVGARCRCPTRRKCWPEI
jgi:hypothetical protein